MDTLDDFTIMNIIVQCDMKTVFTVVPLVCRRMYALYDDVVVARRFQNELRERITAPRDCREQTCTDIILHRHKVRRTHRHIYPQCGTPVRLPLDLVAKADLGAYLLNVTIHVVAITGSRACDRRVFTPATQRAFGRQLDTYIADCSMSCKLTTTFGTICTMFDKCIIANMLAPALRVVYYLRADGYDNWIVRNRAACSDQTVYELGFGCEYNIMNIMIFIDVNLYEIIDVGID